MRKLEEIEVTTATESVDVSSSARPVAQPALRTCAFLLVLIGTVLGFGGLIGDPGVPPSPGPPAPADSRPTLPPSPQAAPLLHTTEGAVMGVVRMGNNSRLVARYANIPYARPPRRWTSPEPPESYPGGRRE
jgi:hypothetical protein